VSETPLAGRTVLILEDEFLIAVDMEQTCLDAGAGKVIIAGDMTDLDEAASFDVAVLDLTLGEGSTAGFAARLGARGLPFVFTTGASDLEALAADFPGVPIVAKPVAGPDLVEALREAVGNPAGPAVRDRTPRGG
jgi:hypothetical protein